MRIQSGITEVDQVEVKAYPNIGKIAIALKKGASHVKLCLDIEDSQELRDELKQAEDKVAKLTKEDY